MAENQSSLTPLIRDDNIPEPNAVIRFLEDRIARFAVPRYLEFVDELPLTENGKVKKYILKEWGVSPETWDRDNSDINRRA